MGQSVGLSVKARVTSNATLVESLAIYPETVQRTANWFRRSLWEANMKSTKQIGDSNGREQELQVEQDGREQQTCDTQRQERELEGILDQVAATMHGLSPTNKTQDSLGPTLTAKVQVEDVSVQALLDTCFPTTIISLDLILPPPSPPVQVLAAKKPKEQTPEQWKNEMRQKLKASTVSLQNYGGGRLELICQPQLS